MRYLLLRETTQQPALFALKVEAAHEIVSVELPVTTQSLQAIEHAGETLNVLTFDELYCDPALWQGAQIMRSVNEFDM